MHMQAKFIRPISEVIKAPEVCREDFTGEFKGRKATAPLKGKAVRNIKGRTFGKR